MEIFGNIDDEPVIEIIKGTDVARLLDMNLRKRMIRELVMANLGNPNDRFQWDEAYFEGYLEAFNERLEDGKINLITVNGEPSGVICIDFCGRCEDGRTLFALSNLVILSDFCKSVYKPTLVSS